MDDGAQGPINFDDLMDQYFGKIFNVIYRLMGDYEEARDLTQDTFIQAYKALPYFRGESKVYTWLYRIAVNRCKNRLKQMQRRGELVTESLDQPLETEDGEIQREVADWSHSPEVVLERRELQRLVQQEIGRLPHDFKEVVVLRDLQGLTYKEISEVLHISIEAVKSRLFRARSLLRERLRPYLEGFEGPWLERG